MMRLTLIIFISICVLPNSFAVSKHKSHLLKQPILTEKAFPPYEAETRVLPYLLANKEIFKNKTVFEIGTGSGVISLYAAQLGAKKVVATDIDADSVKEARANIKRHGFSDVIEVRLVPKTDQSAYSTLKKSEKFDVIISNPPYSLDFTKQNTPWVDSGVLGPSIINGLEEHLKPKGQVILLYSSFFYQQLMVKYARYKSYSVNYYPAEELTFNDAEAAFNSHLEKFIAKANLPKGSLKFDYKKDGWEKHASQFTFYKSVRHRRAARKNKTPTYPGIIRITRDKPSHTMKK